MYCTKCYCEIGMAEAACVSCDHERDWVEDGVMRRALKALQGWRRQARSAPRAEKPREVAPDDDRPGRFMVTWSVDEMVLGPGEHDDGRRGGDVRTLARGVKECRATSGRALRDALVADLRKAFPEHALGPTYNLHRTHHITVTRIGNIGRALDLGG